MKKLFALIFVLLVAGGGYYFYFSGDEMAKQYEGEFDNLTVAVSNLEATTLVRLAKHNGYFEKHGLNVDFIEDDLGKFSLKRLLDGEADIATAAEFPFVAQSFKRDDLRLFSTIHASNKNVRLLVSRDGGAVNIDELVGKKIATTKGTVGEFFLELLLLAHGVDPSEVDIVDMKPADIAQALDDQDIDGFALREPHVYRVEQERGDGVVVFPVNPVDQVYTATFNLVAKNEFIENNRAALERFLSALVDAEDYLQNNVAETQFVISEDLDLDLTYLEDTWEDSDFTLQLTQSLLVGMEDEARWRIENELVDTEEVPNLLQLLETDLLGSVKPKAMQIIKAN